MENLNLQFLQEELKRVSDWIKFSDQKAAFLSVYYSALIGIIISQRSEVVSKLLLHNDFSLSLLYADIFFILFFLFFGVFFLFASIFPRLNNGLTNESLFYFGTMAKMKFVECMKKLESISEIEAKKQIAEQFYTNSLIADQKMNNIKGCIKCLFISGLLIIVFILM